MKPISYTSEPYAEPRLAWPMLMLGGLGCWAVAHYHVGWYWMVLIGIAALVFGQIIHWNAIIEPAAGRVREEARIGKQKVIKERFHSIQDFEAIIFAPLNREPDEWGVGIRHRNGREIWIKSRGFGGDQRSPGRAAEEFAWRLSCDTGIEIEEYRPKKRKLFGLVCFGLVSILFAGCSGERGTSDQVIIYTSQDQVYAEPIFQEFTKQTGIRVRAVYDSEAVKTVGLVNRLLAEKEHPQCDVFWNNEELRTRQLAAQNLFRETNAWASFGFRVRRLVIHTNQLANLGCPRTLLALTNAACRGKVALAYPLFGTTATHFLALRQTWGKTVWEKWCRALQANQPLLVDGNSVVVKMVASGEAWVGLTDSDDIQAAQREGLPVVGIDLGEDEFLIRNTVAVLRNAPHPAPAEKLFVFLQSDEVRQKLVEAGAVLSLTEQPASQVPLIMDWDVLLREQDASIAKLKEIFLR